MSHHEYFFAFDKCGGGPDVRSGVTDQETAFAAVQPAFKKDLPVAAKKNGPGTLRGRQVITGEEEDGAVRGCVGNGQQGWEIRPCSMKPVQSLFQFRGARAGKAEILAQLVRKGAGLQFRMEGFLPFGKRLFAFLPRLGKRVGRLPQAPVEMIALRLQVLDTVAAVLFHGLQPGDGFAGGFKVRLPGGGLPPQLFGGGDKGRLPRFPFGPQLVEAPLLKTNDAGEDSTGPEKKKYPCPHAGIAGLQRAPVKRFFA